MDKVLPDRRARATIWAETQEHLVEAIPEISALMEQKFAQSNETSELSANLDQCGLRDGADITKDFVAHGEYGLALEHSCYMIGEADLVVSAKIYASLTEAG